jgi:hypothetical protein
MLPIREFIGTLAVAGKSFKEIQETVKNTYGNKALKRTPIYEILKKVKDGKPAVDQRHLNSKRKKRTLAFIADVTADIEIDRRVSLNKLARAHGISKRTINLTLRHDLNLTKKSARWVPKLLTEEMKKERVRTSKFFLAMVRRRSLSLLDNIVTMDESTVSFHIPETKQQSMRWLPKGQPGPVKAKVHATRTKQMGGFGVFRFKGPNLYKLRAQGKHGQCQLYRGGPGHVHEDFEKEEAADGGWRLAISLG